MKRLYFFDTNVILDVIAKRKNFFETSYSSLEKAADLGEICLSTLTLHILAYFCKKFKVEIGRLEDFARQTNVLPLLPEVALKAFRYKNLDYEDVLQYLTAVEFSCEILITRNKKDFQKIQKREKIKILTPEEFILESKI